MSSASYSDMAEALASSRARARYARPMSRGRIRIGISGWRYEPWRGAFYPEDLRQDDELAFASRRLSTIEINGSFYSLQRPEYYARWRDETPPGFVFSVKGGRYITHMKRLREIEAPVANFFGSGIDELGDKLGPFLWQFPPSFAFDPGRFASFFELLPRDTSMLGMPGRSRPLRHAFEIRHPSFETPAFVALLREHDVGLVVADTAGRWPLAEDVTSDFVYVRLHGDRKLYESGYTIAALERWAARIRAWSGGTQAVDAQLIAPEAKPRKVARDVFVYFDNDIKVKAPRDAMRLAQMLGVAWTPADDRFAAHGKRGVRTRGPLRPERRRNPWPAARG